MAKPTSLPPGRPFKFAVNHRKLGKLEPLLTDAERRKRKADPRKRPPVRAPWDRSRQDD